MDGVRNGVLRIPPTHALSTHHPPMLSPHTTHSLHTMLSLPTPPTHAQLQMLVEEVLLKIAESYEDAYFRMGYSLDVLMPEVNTRWAGAGLLGWAGLGG